MTRQQNNENTDETVSPFRIAIRTEGEYVNAYFAQRDTMSGAFLLGSLRLSVANAGMFEPWLELMKDAVSQMIAATYGVDCRFPHPPESAPQHERSGRA